MAIFSTSSLWPFTTSFGLPVAVDPVGARFYGNAYGNVYGNAGTYNPNPLNPGYPPGSFGVGALVPGVIPSGAIDTSPSSNLIIGGLVVASAAVGGLAVWALGGAKRSRPRRRKR